LIKSLASYLQRFPSSPADLGPALPGHADHASPNHRQRTTRHGGEWSSLSKPTSDDEELLCVATPQLSFAHSLLARNHAVTTIRPSSAPVSQIDKPSCSRRFKSIITRPQPGTEAVLPCFASSRTSRSSPCSPHHTTHTNPHPAAVQLSSYDWIDTRYTYGLSSKPRRALLDGPLSAGARPVCDFAEDSAPGAVVCLSSKA
jgi:hypothetical protein